MSQRRIMPTRRGAFLLTNGCIFAVIGAALVVLPVPDSSQSGYRFATTLMPLQWWGVVWMAVAAVGIVTSRWPVGKDVYGFGVLTGWSLLWAAMAVMSTILDDSGRGWYLGVIWASFGVQLMIVAGMDSRTARRRV